MREVTLAGLRAMFAQSTGSAIIPAVTLTHDTYSEPLRVAANTVPLVVDGNEYVACPFELTLAQDTDQSVTQPQISIDNVDAAISEAVRTVPSAPGVTLEIFRADPDGTVERQMGPDSYSLLSAKVDAQKVVGILGYQTDFLNAPAVHDLFVPAVAPGLF